MLQLVVNPPDGRWSYQKRLIDEYRQIVFAPLGTLDRGVADAYLSTWENRVIPVLVGTSTYQDEKGERFLVINSTAVNPAGVGLIYGIDPYLFEGVQEQRTVESMAAECVVAFAELARGLKVTMASDGGTLDDFLPEGARLIQRGLA